MIRTILEVLMFALAFTFLFSWGFVKSQRQEEELYSTLMRKCRAIVIKEFRKEKILSHKELSKLITGVKASLFWSKKKIIVDKPETVLDIILKEMIEKGDIKELRQKTYELTRG